MQKQNSQVSTQKMSAMTRKIRRFHRLRRKICKNLRYLRMVRQPLRAHILSMAKNRPEGFLEQLYGQNRAFGTVRRLIPDQVM